MSVDLSLKQPGSSFQKLSLQIIPLLPVVLDTMVTESLILFNIILKVLPCNRSSVEKQANKNNMRRHKQKDTLKTVLNGKPSMGSQIN